MTANLTLYYDGKCNFCTQEMIRLSRWDRQKRLAFVDIAQPGFDPSSLGVSMADLNREIVSQTAEGKVLIGVDSMLMAYPLVGKGYLVWPLRVPGLRQVLTLLYRQFAKHRYTMSKILGYKKHQCEEGVCGIGNPFLRDKNKS